MRIVRESSRLVAYNNGFLYEFSTTSIIRWEKNVNSGSNVGATGQNIMMNGYTKKIHYASKIEATHPGYLHFLFRKAITLNGPKAGFQETAAVTNDISRIP